MAAEMEGSREIQDVCWRLKARKFIMELLVGMENGIIKDGCAGRLADEHMKMSLDF